MILGIGTDIVSISRIEAASMRHPTFYQRILTPEEQEVYSSEPLPAAYLAKRFAAKEAIAKALGCGIGARMSWQEVTTRRGSRGRPEVVLEGKALEEMQRLGGTHCHLSLSDEADLALAFAVIESTE